MGIVTFLLGRRSEHAALDALVRSVSAGESRALVVRGDPGVGKSTLLAYVAERAKHCRIVHAVGVESEMELPLAGLQQLCAPLLDRLERLPAPRRDALATAFGLCAGEAPDRFLVSLAVLSLLGEAAEQAPVICLVDDAQWLDRASAQVLAFVACALLESAIAGPLDDRVRDRIVAETAGNPSALLELPRGRNPAELGGGFGLPGAIPLPGAGELITVDDRVCFRHPLVRPAVYRVASAADRRRAHAALAGSIAAGEDADRRAWHRSHAAAAPDEARRG
jgi:hypothetical protein